MEAGDNHGFVTHFQVGTMTTGGQIEIMNKGRTTQVGAPIGPYECIANTLVAESIGSPQLNISSPNDLLIDAEPTVVSSGGRAGMPGARAGHLLNDIYAGAVNIGEAIAVRIEDLGHEAPFHLNTRCCAALTARASGAVRGKIASGATVPLAAMPDRLRTFDLAAGERLT